MNGKKNILIISFVFLIFIILNFSITLNGSGDDSILFLGPLTSKFGGNYIDFLLNRYQNWSSRLIIEIFTLLSVQHHFFLADNKFIRTNNLGNCSRLFI